MVCLRILKRRRAKTDSELGELVYNERIARMRVSEYPMLRGEAYVLSNLTFLLTKACRYGIPRSRRDNAGEQISD